MASTADAKAPVVEDGKSERGKAMAQYMQYLAPIGKAAYFALQFAFPIVMAGSKAVYAVYSIIPIDLLHAIIGIVLCFCGGLYPTLFAALEAARLSGWENTQNALVELGEQVFYVMNASKKDDDLDEDHDGVADVKQIDAQHLFQRKMMLAVKVCDPRKIDHAVVGIYTSWMAVVCTLKVQFARTITLALSIADFLNTPSQQFLVPAVVFLMPKNVKTLEKDSKGQDIPKSSPAEKWSSVIVGWICKSIAMSIAWYIQTIISAFTSAVRGGLMCSRGLMAFAAKRGFRLGGLIKENDEDTYMDEVFGWMLAGLGFYFQYSMGFDVPFPFNLLLFPFEMAEWYIRWTITSA
mmetsp:Transcript_28337/g.63298  ORF Transcript_28337/g.63298 Transcript_28337/m.63298 type:complete len:350 (+) Transcript_28337:48-1097(+)|eukprot:CAMPEP_0172616754 /NCGR_PEP_ID=MMETSP1068-20121228/67253_1 /TAXON_ID=35684 /ORGANISM="Pseudopedinella elastica, Strain CCMP716" /LENGTH=349 /DNA_ID=CAMNT_0013422285 /DNA_START=9 /DNA_END=1058 /DNA_ORIENTATION=+